MEEPLGLRPRSLLSMRKALLPIENSPSLSNLYLYLNGNNKAANNITTKLFRFLFL